MAEEKSLNFLEEIVESDEVHGLILCCMAIFVLTGSSGVSNFLSVIVIYIKRGIE